MAYPALRAGLQRSRRSDRTGKIHLGRADLDKPSPRSRRPQALDHRFSRRQNDATVKGSGSHDKTGHHCLPGDPKGKLKISRTMPASGCATVTAPYEEVQAHLLGRLHVPTTKHVTANLEQHPRAMIAVPRRPRLE